MRWSHPSAQGDKELDLFLRRHEVHHVQAISRYLSSNSLSPLWVARDKAGKVLSYVFYKARCPLFLIMDDAVNPSDWALRRLTNNGAPSSLQGRPEETELAARALHKAGRRVHRVRYRIMDLEGAPSGDALKAGPSELIIREAQSQDEAALYPIQRAYEEEEVAPPGTGVDELSCRINLRRIINELPLMVAEVDGRIVGKANINARSFSRDQLGGVYVLPEFRGRGIARRLAASLAASVNRRQRTCCLFVKTRNAAAIAAYKAVGFKDRGAYEIRYFL